MRRVSLANRFEINHATRLVPWFGSSAPSSSKFGPGERMGIRGRVSKTNLESSAAAEDAGTRYQASASLGSLENPSFAAVDDS
jgi:hypothetical protein